MSKSFLPAAAASTLKLLLTGALWLALPQAWAADTAPACNLQPFTATYSARGMGMSLLIKRQLQRETDGHWLAGTATSRLFYSLNESSRFQLDGRQLLPLEYQYTQKPGGKKNQHWRFDHAQRQVRSLRADQPWLLVLEAGAQDKLSYQLQMGLDLQCQGHAPRELAYAVPDEDKYDSYRWRIHGEEMLDTELGRVNTVKLERLRSSQKRHDFMWLAPDWGYQMVLLRHTEKGETSDTRILSLELDGKAVTAR